MKWLFFWRRHAAPAKPKLAENVPFMVDHNEREVQRLNGQHFAIQAELGGNFAAPLVGPTAILDVGCGTGRWAMEMAVTFPQAQVVGLDIIPPDPTGSLGLGIDVLPSNATFMQADATQPLPFADASFDYVHLCMLYAVIPVASWVDLVRECIRVVRPGGWVESVEALAFSNPTEKSGMATITLWFSELLRTRGADPLVALKIAGWLSDGGLTQGASREITDNAAEEDPQEAIDAATALVDYLRIPVTAAGIATAELFEKTAAQALADVRYSSRGSGFNTYVTYAQRPVE
jgi:ubiquinone/menaquinone biosynthesis C-methylase UbiE